MSERTVTVTLDSIKDPDAWGHVVESLGLSDEQSLAYLEWGEYATIELTVSSDMTFTGRILPRIEVTR